MITKDKINSYFEHNQRLRVLFVFDPSGMGTAADLANELAADQPYEGYRYHQFDGVSWFNLKYRLEHDWKDDKVVLIMNQEIPVNTQMMTDFPLMDLLVANATYREENHMAFIEQYDLPQTADMVDYVSRHISELRLKKSMDAMSGMYNAQDFTPDNINRGFISVYLKQKSVLSWDSIIARIVILGQAEEQKNRDAFYKQLFANRDAFDALQNRLQSITGQQIEPNTIEKVSRVATAIKYNSLVQGLPDMPTDNYRQLRLVGGQKLARFNQMLENVRSDKRLNLPFQNALAELAGGIREEEIIALYGVDANYAYMNDALCWPILRQVLSTQLLNDPAMVSIRMNALDQKLNDEAKTTPVIRLIKAMADFYENATVAGSMILNTPDDYIQQYTTQYYLIDFYYRRILELFYQLQPSECPIYSELAQQKQSMDLRYTNYCFRLNEEWIKCVKEVGQGSLSAVHMLRQQDFYQSEVAPLQVKRAVIVSDAMRYEVAVELMKKLEEKKHKTELKPALAGLPTETKYCKPALLPHNTLTFSDNNLLVDGKVMASLPLRTAQMQQFVAGALCVDYNTVIQSTQAENRERFKSPLVYIMHDKIDREGHDQSANETVTACRETVNSLAALVHTLHMTYNVAEVFITSDHGFLFEDKKFEDKDKHQMGEAGLEKKTRYYLTQSPDEVTGLIKFPLGEASGMTAQDIYVAVPNSTNRMAATGGYKFAHGGATLQEMITPVIHSSMKRDDTRETVKISWVGNDLSIKSSILKFGVIQNQPVSANLRALKAKYAVYANGKPITKLEDIIFDCPTDGIQERLQEHSITVAHVPADATLLELRIYDENDDLNPVLSHVVKNTTLFEIDVF